MRQSKGLLIDPESLKSLRKVKSWDPENDGIFKREFSRNMGNTAEYNMKKLILHLLDKKSNRMLLHPKVTMKKSACVLVDYYTAKEWLEHNKQKQAV